MAMLLPGQMPPLLVPMDSHGRLPDGRMVISKEVVTMLHRLRQASANPHGIQLKTLNEHVEDLFEAIFTTQGFEFEIKT